MNEALPQIYLIDMAKPLGRDEPVIHCSLLNDRDMYSVAMCPQENAREWFE